MITQAERVVLAAEELVDAESAHTRVMDNYLKRNGAATAQDMLASANELNVKRMALELMVRLYREEK